MFEWIKRMFGPEQVPTETRSYSTGDLSGYLLDPTAKYENKGFVKACIKVIAESIGMLSFRVYEKVDNGRKLRNDLPLDFLLSREPNDYLTAPVFFEALVADVLAHGNSITFIDVDSQSNPNKLTLLNPLDVDIRTSTVDTTISYWYKGSMLDPLRLLHIQVNPDRNGVGRSPLTIARENILLSGDAMEFAKAYFKNGGGLRNYLTTANKLSEPTLNRLERHFKGKFTGVANAGAVPILEEGLELKSLVNSLADSLFLESRKFEEQEIATIFRIPLSKLNMLDRSTHSNIEQQQLDFLTDTLMPLIIKIEKEFTRKLFKTYESNLYIKADLRQILRTDTVARGAFYRNLFNMGAISINEIRSLEEFVTKPELEYHYLNAATSKIEEDGNLAVQMDDAESTGKKDIEDQNI